MDNYVKIIEFDQVKNFWCDFGHFPPESRDTINFNVRNLGHFKNHIREPEVVGYGLFQNDELIGVTMMYQWNWNWVRFRTISIKKSFRRQGLGPSLLATAYLERWHGKDLFGWIRNNIYGWSRDLGFEEIDGVWSDRHLGMLLKGDALSSDQFKSKIKILPIV